MTPKGSQHVANPIRGNSTPTGSQRASIYIQTTRISRQVFRIEFHLGLLQHPDQFLTKGFCAVMGLLP